MEDYIIALCKTCKSCNDGKCTDCFEPGVKYACINYLENDNADKRNDN